MGIATSSALQDELLDLDLETQLSLHFSSNCYPPIPQQMIPTAIEALDLVNEGYGINPVYLPEIVDSYRLDAWVVESEEV